MAINLPPPFTAGERVRVINHPNRAGQYGEVSNLPAPSGFFYVRIAPIGNSRDKAPALRALAANEHSALAALEANQLEKVA
jgi:hypothetical protein